MNKSITISEREFKRFYKRSYELSLLEQSGVDIILMT